jgi:hypothetical protein
VTAVRTLPPCALPERVSIQLTRNNFGGSFLSWPWANASATTWNADGTWCGDTYPANSKVFFDAGDILPYIGVIRSFKWSFRNLWNSSQQLGTTSLANLLRQWDWYIDKNVVGCWSPQAVSALDQTHIAWDTGANGLLTNTNGTTGPEAQTKAFMEALFASPLRSPKGYSVADHPGLRYVQLFNECDAIVAASQARIARIIVGYFRNYRTVATVYTCQQQQGALQGTPVRDYLYASAATIATPPVTVFGNDGTGQVLLDVMGADTPWDQHYYLSLRTMTQAANPGNNSPSAAETNGRNATPTSAVSLAYFYSSSTIASGVWSQAVRSQMPGVINSENDLSGNEMPQLSTPDRTGMVGNGTFTAATAINPTATESWTAVATDATHFDVTSSALGALGVAQTGVPFVGTSISFTITAGSTPFIAGDTFTITDGFMWGKLSPLKRREMDIRYRLGQLLVTSDGSGNLGVNLGYAMDSTAQDTVTTISSVTRSTLNQARIMLVSCGTQGPGPYDEIVIETTGEAWPDLGMGVNQLKRFTGANVAITGNQFDLLGTSVPVTFALPAGVTVYHSRFIYEGAHQLVWLNRLLQSGTLHLGYTYLPHASVTTATNLAPLIAVNDGQGMPIYTATAAGNLIEWV